MGVAGLAGVVIATAFVGVALGGFVMRWRYKQKLEAIEIVATASAHGGPNGSRSNITHSPSRGAMPPNPDDSPRVGSDSPRNPLLRA